MIKRRLVECTYCGDSELRRITGAYCLEEVIPKEECRICGKASKVVIQTMKYTALLLIILGNSLHVAIAVQRVHLPVEAGEYYGCNVSWFEAQLREAGIRKEYEVIDGDRYYWEVS